MKFLVKKNTFVPTLTRYPDFRWYVAIEGTTHYLHKDGSIQYSTRDNRGIFGGYYKTRKEARESVRRWKETLIDG